MTAMLMAELVTTATDREVLYTTFPRINDAGAQWSEKTF